MGGWLQLGAALLILTGLGFLSFAIARWNWRVRGLPPAGGLFARLLRIGGWFGVRTNDATTPYEFSRALTRTLPGSEPAVRSITNAYYAEQFDPDRQNPESLVAAQSGWKQVRRNLVRWRLRRRRAR